MSAVGLVFRQQRQWSSAASVCWRCQRRFASQVTNTAGRVPSSGFRYIQKGSQTSQDTKDAESLGLQVPSFGEATEAVLRDKGIDGLLTRYPFEQAWYTYQGRLLKNINNSTANTGWWNKNVKNIAMSTARDPKWAALFNYASMAHNNHFFFSGINLDGTKSTGPSATLTRALEPSFHSIETLKKEFILSAYTMFGPGFTWLVVYTDKSARAQFAVLNTYLAGSPYRGAHNRQQPLDMNTQSLRSAAEQGWGGIRPLGAAAGGDVANSVGAFGNLRSTRQVAYGGVDVTPVLCVNTWEHVWMIDYTVVGKHKFLENWWDRINWQVVEERYGDRPMAQF